MKIRWKLFLTLFLLTGGATVAVLVVAEREFRAWVGGQVEEVFQRGVDGLLDLRKERLAGIREISTKLADDVAVKETLRGGNDQKAIEMTLTRFRELRGGRGAGPGEDKGAGPDNDGRRGEGGRMQQIPVLGVMNESGEFRFLERDVAMRRPRGPQGPKGRERALKELGAGAGIGAQDVGYVIAEASGKRPATVHEVVVTPVVDAGRRIGWFLLGLEAVSQEDRAVARAESASGREMHTGLVVGGEWFVEGIDESLSTELVANVDEDFWSGGEPRLVEAGGATYLMMARDLNPGSPLAKGYQIGVFPMSQMQQAIGRLRWTVVSVGLAGLALAGVAGWLLSLRFSRPIHELVEGTVRLRSGDFGHRVKVRSRDEFGTLAGAFNEMVAELGLKEKYHDLLGKTSDPSVARHLIEGSMDLGGELRDVAVIFCDIRGFTSMTEGMEPGKVIDLLNEHMTAMNGVIHAHGGVVDKYVGDLVMAVFGAPVSKPDDLGRAAACAVAMVEERRRLNATEARTVEVGVGFSAGKVVSGLMGSKDRLNYTVLGERVNLASRLCSLAAAGEILVDDATADRIGKAMTLIRRDTIAVKGFREKVKIWSLEGNSA